MTEFPLSENIRSCVINQLSILTTLFLTVPGALTLTIVIIYPQRMTTCVTVSLTCMLHHVQTVCDISVYLHSKHKENKKLNISSDHQAGLQLNEQVSR